MMFTKFVLVKENLVCSTRSLHIVKSLQTFGWKVKQSNLGELI